MNEFPGSPVPPLEAIAIRITDPVEPGPPDIISGLLPRRGECVIAGETDVGKSLVALEICSALTTGTPLWGELKPTLEAKKILYVLGEHYDAVIQRLLQHTRLPMGNQVWLLGPEKLGWDKWLVAQGKPNHVAIDKFKRWAEGMDLVVFDPFSSFISGVDAENDNIQMRLVLDSMSLIAQSAGASCLVLAHLGKPMIDQFGKEHAKKSYAIRGASAIEDAATNIFYMSAIDGKSEASEGRKILSVKRRKYKGIAPDEYKLVRDPATLTHTLLGNRPFIEVRKQEIQAKSARIQAGFPEFKFAQVLRMLAASENLSEATVRRYVEGG